MGRHVIIGSRLSAISCLWLAVGCAGESNFASDPLLGGPPAARSAGPPTATPTSSAPKQTAVPPLAVPSSSTSTAALATGSVPPLDARADLRTVGPSGNWKAPGTKPGAVLQPPEVASDGFPRIDAPAPAGFTLTGGAAQPLTYEQAQSQLTARGVTWQRLEAGTEPGEWKFGCAVPNRQNPHIRRVYEAQARDPIAAMRAVLDQMGREH